MAPDENGAEGAAEGSARAHLPILHFNDVYRVKQTSRALGGTISADQFAAKIASLRQAWGEQAREPHLIGSEAGIEDEDEEASQERKKESAADTKAKEGSENRNLRGLVLFSGDVFNPSIESSVTRGEHMIDVLNSLSIDCACLGNHDFDFGYPHLQRLMSLTNFPWTFSNIADVATSSSSEHSSEQPFSDEPHTDDGQVGGTLRSWIAPSIKGIRVGCIGLVEKEWIATVPAFPPHFRYRSMAQVARRISRELRSGPQPCDIVIAITHCRLPNDIDLANELGAVRNAPIDQHGVDLILGGHDHMYYIGKGVDQFEGESSEVTLPGSERDRGCMIVKSGTDFQDLSEIDIELSDLHREPGAVRRRTITRASVQRHKTKPSDPTLPELKSHIDSLMSRVDQATGQPVAFSLTPLDCRADRVRTEESAVGNLIADILMHSYEDALRERDKRGEFEERRPEDVREIDMCLICGGSLRGDSVFGPGTIALRDILTIAPFEDSIIVKEMKGSDILEALENGFSSYPSQEGRFPQTAGLYIKWDSRKKPGERLVEVRLLEDIHMLHPDGSKIEREDSSDGTDKGSEDRRGSTSSSSLTSYAFERSAEGGYSIDVNKPRLRKGARLDPNRLYRVATREYMADGHDGYTALSRGKDLIDHENGSLMSTQVRKFLLGANLIWRLKSFRDSADEKGRGKVGIDGMLSSKTSKAVDRAHAISRSYNQQRQQQQKRSSSSQGDQTPSTPARKPKGRNMLSDLNGAGGAQPQKIVIDSSPGGIRDAMHVGSSEHHSRFDAVTRHYKNASISSSPLSKRGESKARGARSVSTSSASTSSYDGEAGAAAADDADESMLSNSMASLHAPSTDGGSGGGGPPTSPAVERRHLEVSPEDGEALREKSNSDLAIICPLIDGRMVDVARLSSAE